MLSASLNKTFPSFHIEILSELQDINVCFHMFIFKVKLFRIIMSFDNLQEYVVCATVIWFVLL